MYPLNVLSYLCRLIVIEVLAVMSFYSDTWFYFHFQVQLEYILEREGGWNAVQVKHL